MRFFSVGIPLLLVVAAFIVMHEGTHATIFEEFGCDYEYHFFDSQPSVVGYCYGLDADERNTVRLAQANVEAFQYPMLLIILLLFGILVKEEG